ncbi:GNAT family N-acetyltransferase [Paenibacillaceae bacterium]|nr:GNAT family N-acetyltransferase [Paenibacillaceae bacterium]
MEIRKLILDEQPPMELLLLADPSPELVNDYLKRGDCYVAVADGSIIGVYVLLPTRPETVEIVNVAVAESRQGEGIGKRLVNHAIAQAREHGFRTVEIGTGNSGVGQLALYQKCGFRITGVDRDFFIRHYDEAIFENGIQVIDMVRLAQDLQE